MHLSVCRLLASLLAAARAAALGDTAAARHTLPGNAGVIAAVGTAAPWGRSAAGMAERQLHKSHGSHTTCTHQPCRIHGRQWRSWWTRA